MRRPHRRHLTAMIAAALVATACGGGAVDVASDPPTSTATSTTGSATPTPTEPAGPEVVAGLGIIEEAVERATADAPEEFTAGAEDDDIAVGDVVRTDVTGFAQLDWADGSLTRIDTDTTVTIAALGDADTPEVDLVLDVGRVWNNVRDLDDDGSFQVTTDVGVAAVRGTVFVVQCFEDTSCLFAVVEGIVEVTLTADDVFTLAAGDQLLVLPDGTAEGGVVPSPPDFLDDPWFQSNLALDGGPAPAAGAGVAPVGDYAVTWSLPAPIVVDSEIDDALNTIFAPSAFAGLPLAPGATTTDLFTFGDNGAVATNTLNGRAVLEGSGDAYEFGYRDLPLGVDGCAGETIGTSYVTVQVVERDADGVPTDLTGEGVFIDENPDAENCIAARVNARWTFTATRVGDPSADRIS